jgi:phenylacetate-CoA ligase
VESVDMSLRTLLYLHDLRKSLRQDPLEREKNQIRKFRELAEHAYRNVSFYHKKFAEAKIIPSNIRTLDDIAKVPVTTRAEIQAAPMGEVVARNIDPKKCVTRMTSGSTGIPLTVVLEKEALDIERALVARTYFEDGYKLWHKMIRIMDIHDFPPRRRWYQHLGIARMKYLSTFDEAEEQMRIIEGYRPDGVRGYASYLERLAHFCRQSGREMRLQTVFTAADLLHKGARELINSVFHTSLFDLYVSTEFGLAAWECRDHYGYHINSESVLLETLKNGEVVCSNERGEITCTNLVNAAMPLIRYKTGDIGMRIDERCPCGNTLPLLKIIEGRTGDFLTTMDGKVIPPTIFFPYPFENVAWIKQFRIIQEKLDRIVIQLVPKENFQPDHGSLDRARTAIKEVFGENMNVEIQILDKIGRDPGNKLRKIISKVPVNLDNS